MISNSVGISTTGDVAITLHVDETLLKRFAEKKTLSLKINIHCGSKNNTIQIPPVPEAPKISTEAPAPPPSIAKIVPEVQVETSKIELPSPSKEMKVEDEGTEVSKVGVISSW
uniref:SHSP domain-containing protein n=1 Tax=Steinernema glaseri TaxID=37863 RepID=A0A1I8AVU8_9BILA